MTVNDGFVESDPVTTTVNVTPVNDAPAANDDAVITNVANPNFAIQQSALLANDTDPEGSPVTITSSWRSERPQRPCTGGRHREGI